MPLRLRVISPSSGSPEQSINLEDGVTQVRIGRRADLELSLAFSSLSGVHARLVRPDQKAADHHWLLEDLGSTNGTFLAGERLKPGVKHPVTPGAQIKLAEVQLIFDGEIPATEPTVVVAEANAPIAVAKVPAAAARVPRVETKAAVEAKAPVVEAKAAVVEAKAAVVEVKPAVVDTKAPPPAKAGAAERTETFVRRKTSEAAVSPRAVTATVPLLSAVSGLNEGVTTFRI